MAEQNKTMYSLEEMQRIYTELHPGALLVPIAQPAAGGYQPGPHFFIYRMYSEMGLTPSDTLVAFWEALQDASALNAIHEFATINANLTEPKIGDGQIQLQMIQRYIEPELRVKLLEMDRLQGNAHSVVFNRIGCLQTIRYLILYGGLDQFEGRPIYKIGRLALLGNEFLAHPPVPQTTSPSNLDIILMVAPTWDIMNARHLGHGMARMAFERHGEQHYRKVRHFHRTMEAFQLRRQDDAHKLKLCAEHGLSLFVIPYTVSYGELETFVREEAAKSGIAVPRKSTVKWKSLPGIYDPGDLSRMQEIAQGRGGACLSPACVNNSTKLLWCCAENHEWKATPAHIAMGACSKS
jgi:hypothetical protein